MIRRLIGALAVLRTRGASSSNEIWICAALSCSTVLSGCSAQALSSRSSAFSVPAAAAVGSSQLPSPRVTLEGEEEFVVRIVAPGTTCSGTLISADLVLTAHHCVSVHDAHGSIRAEDVDASELRVELGTGRFPVAEVPVRAVVAPPCGYAAGLGDVSILVLARPLGGLRTLEPELEYEPTSGDVISHLGFGRCSTSGAPVQLKQRAGGAIDLVTSSAFRGSVPLCPGDSGGPVILRNTGALIGVVSAGAMDSDELTPDRAEFARLDFFRPLFSNAERIAAGTPPSELPPIECTARNPE